MRMVIVLASAGLLACTPVQLVTSFTPTHAVQPPIAVDRVELVFGGHVTRPYRELGVAALDAIAGRPPAPTYPELLAKLREVGAHNGCDALLVNPLAFAARMTELTATCVAYTD